jgi:hypothetical protein
MDFYKRIMEWSPEARDAAVKARKNKPSKTGDPARRAEVEKLARRGQAGSSGSEGEIDATDPKLHPSDDDDDDLPDLPPKPGVKLDKDRTPAEIAARKKKKERDDQIIAIGKEKRLNKEARIVRKTKKNEKIGGKALPDGPPQSKQPDDEEEAELDAEDEGPMETNRAENKEKARFDAAHELASAKNALAFGQKKKKSVRADLRMAVKRAEDRLDRESSNGKKDEDQDWIQKAVNPKHKGYCTPMTKDTCTPARKALAKRFKKAARKEKKSGGTGWEGKV